MKTRTRNLTLAFAGVGVLIACTAGACDSNTTAQDASQDTTNKVAAASSKAVPYPFDQMNQGKWLELQMLRENLLRQNNKAAARYVTWLTQQGQIVAQWPIQGMVFDPNSQMTATNIVSPCKGDGSGACSVAVTAPGDNGTYGPEAMCYAFYDVKGVEHQLSCTAIVLESDSPDDLTSKPLITYNINGAPSVGNTKVGN